MNDILGALVGAVLQAVGLLAVAPLLRGGIKKMKATMQMRKGPPLLQGYYDLAKLFRKETVRSETASWVYVLGPRLYFAAAVAATMLVPVLVAASPLEGAGGILGLVGILALGRFALAAAALDTGSPFGGMGSSREMTIAALAEPALMLGLFTSALAAGSLDLGAVVRGALVPGVALSPERHPGAVGTLRRADRRDRSHSRGQSGDTSRADDDSRGHGARVRRAGPRPRRMGVGAQRAAVHHAAHRSLHSARDCHDHRARARGDRRRGVGGQGVRLRCR